MNELEIVELLLQKDEKGMSELLIHYGPLMRYIIAPILPNAQDREDCLSECAMQVWKKIEKFDPQRGGWSAWLTATRSGARWIACHTKTGHCSTENITICSQAPR